MAGVQAAAELYIVCFLYASAGLFAEEVLRGNRSVAYASYLDGRWTTVGGSL